MKLGIVGTGTIVKETLPHFEEWGYEVVALCGTLRSHKVVEELAKQYHIDGQYTDYDLFLQNSEPEIVYVAVPNHLHYEMAKKALLAGKHVIVEKPFCDLHAKTLELIELAKRKGLFLFEAISTVYIDNYNKIKELAKRVGTIKIVNCNFSQYSRRYEAFQRGEILPVFDETKAGGALMDLNVYNIFWAVGLFGEPDKVLYRPNLEKGIDTSGVLILDYKDKKVVSIAAKDCAAPSSCVIQGELGYLLMEGPSNICKKVKLHLNDGTIEEYQTNHSHRMEAEFDFFKDVISNNKKEAMEQALELTKQVSRVLDLARN